MPSPLRRIALIALAIVIPAAVALAQERPPLKGITAVRVSNYGVPSKLFEGKEEVSAMVAEFEALRAKRWRQAELKMRCYATVQFMNGTKPVTVFRVRPEYVLERAPDKAVPTYNLQITDADLPVLRKVLTEIPPSKDCG